MASRASRGKAAGGTGLVRFEEHDSDNALFAVPTNAMVKKFRQNPIFPASKHVFFPEVATALRFSKCKPRSCAQT